MHNYYPEVVWSIDKALSIFSALLGLAIILYALLQEYFYNRHTKHLLAIKQNLRGLSSAGQALDNSTCPAVLMETPEEFLDIEMNREAVLFNKQEKEYVKRCFASHKKLGDLKKMALSEKNRWRRIEAILSMGYTEDAALVDILKTTITDKDEDIRYYSLISLGMIKTEESAGVLISYLDKEIVMANKTVALLASFPLDIVEAVISPSNESATAVRFWKIKLLSQLKSVRYAGWIAGMITDISADVRAAACEYLGRITMKDYAPLLIKCLKDDAWFVRMHAVRALTQILGDGALLEVIPLIKDSSFFVKESVKEAMISHIEAAFPFLEKVFSGNDEIAKRETVEAIESSRAVSKMLSPLISEDGQKRRAAAGLLKAMVSANAHFGLAALLAGLGPEIRLKALEIIRGCNIALAAEIEKDI